MMGVDGRVGVGNDDLVEGVGGNFLENEKERLN